METTLASLLDQIDELDDDRTVYASKRPTWSENSRAIACREPDDGPAPDAARGLTYLLDVDIAKGAIRVWSAWRGNIAPTTKDKVDAVIYYATHDAYLPVEGEE